MIAHILYFLHDLVVPSSNLQPFLVPVPFLDATAVVLDELLLENMSYFVSEGLLNSADILVMVLNKFKNCKN